MAIASMDDLAAAMASSRHLAYFKGSLANMAAGQFASLWRAPGNPAQGATPGAWATPDDSTTGAFAFTNPTAPAKTYWVNWGLICATSNGVALFDRLGHMGGLSGTVTTAQTVNGTIPARGGYTPQDVEWYLEWYTDTGGTAVTATITYTNQNDVSGRTCTVSLAATRRAGTMLYILPSTSGDYIKSIQSVTLSATTGTAGSFGVTCCRRVHSTYAVANQPLMLDAMNLGCPEIPDDACLFFQVLCSTTSTNSVYGAIDLGQK